MKKKYENSKIRVFWDSEKCIHSTNCISRLPNVFNTRKRPWIDINAAEPEEMKRCIDTCPSGGLTYEILGETPKPK